MNTQTASFNVNSDDARLLHLIAKRAVHMAAANGFVYPIIDADMDLTACHANGCTLKLTALLTADDSNFAHDVFGIQRHIDRASGKLQNCFLPRFAL